MSIHSPNAPTFYRPRPDIPDIALSKNIPYIVDVQVIIELSSDYDPILVSFGARTGSANDDLRRTVE